MARSKYSLKQSKQRKRTARKIFALAMACLVSLSLFSGWPELPFFPKGQKAYATFPTVSATNTSNTSSGTTHTVNLPTGISSGNLLITLFTFTVNTTVTWPSGWNSIINAGGICGISQIRYKIADGTEGSTMNLTVGSGGESAHHTYRITNWDGVTPPEGASVGSGGGTLTPNPPSLSPSWGAADNLWIAAMMPAFYTTTLTSYPTNYSNGLNNNSSGGAGCRLSSARRQLNTATEDPGNFTITASPSSPWSYAMTVAVKPAPAFTQRAFRFYEDGSESGSSAVDSQDTNINRLTDSDSNLALRLSVQETANSGGASTDDWQLQYSKNGGAYTDVTTSSSNVKGYNSGSLTDAGATTNRATNGISDPGTGSFVAGLISEDGLLDNHQLTAANYTEHLFSLTIVAADTAAGDTLDFRILYKGAATNMTYSVTPRITVTKTGPSTDQVMRHGNWFSGGTEQDLYWAD